MVVGGLSVGILSFSLMVPELGRMASAMETFTLIVWFLAADRSVFETRKPGLTESDCLAFAAVHARNGQRAQCAPEKAPPMICGFGNCWRNGSGSVSPTALGPGHARTAGRCQGVGGPKWRRSGDGAGGLPC